MKEDLAAWMQIEPIELLAVLDGDKHIDAEFALKIENTIGVDAYYWLRMQAKFDIDTLRIKEPKKSPGLYDDALSSSPAILSEPKSAYANLGKKPAIIFISGN
ncbi:MAG: helix-turn-helix transcriptional regulator [Bacteroidia bacterium]